MPPRQRVGGHINLPLSGRSSVRPFVRPDIDTWFVRLYPPTVLGQFFNTMYDVLSYSTCIQIAPLIFHSRYVNIKVYVVKWV
jgi:hypothetical protein